MFFKQTFTKYNRNKKHRFSHCLVLTSTDSIEKNKLTIAIKNRTLIKYNIVLTSVVRSVRDTGTSYCADSVTVVIRCGCQVKNNLKLITGYIKISVFSFWNYLEYFGQRYGRPKIAERVCYPPLPPSVRPWPTITRENLLW